VILNRIFREPLLHFLIAGGLLFGIFTWSHRGAAKPASGKTIVVDKTSLLNFLQYRNKAFKPDYFESQLNTMSPRELQDLSDQYVEEELLYREAKSLGLEEGDDVIRQRLVQKMNFLIEDLADTSGTPSDAELEAYLKNNQSPYIIEPSVTFTHVFADSSVHGEKAAKELGERLKTQLNSTHAAFNDAPQFGDRFPFLQNYVERTFDYIASHFGKEFAGEIQKLTPSQSKWVGPIRSEYGYHLLLMTSRSEGRIPQLQEIRSQVEEDWLRDRKDKARALSLRELANQYTIERKVGNATK
jgi:parvulin-like peptidyl-prolyl isomerase